MATSKPLVFAERIILHFELDQYFSRVFGSEVDGTRSIGVTYGYGSQDELLRAGADSIVHSVRELPSAFG